MSFYNGAVLTHTIEPTFHSRTRSEFRINKEGLYFSNWRLVDIGVTRPEGFTRIFTDNVGNWPIKTMYLLDGSTELSRLVNKEWKAWLNRLGTNEDAINMKDLKGTSLGYTLGLRDDGLVALSTTTSLYPNSCCRLTDNEENTSHSYADLRKVLPFLSATPYLHTGVFNNLRLVIEWDYEFLVRFIETAGPSSQYLNITPKLVVDEILDEKLADEQKNKLLSAPLLWYEVEVEKFVLNSVVDNATADLAFQNATYRSNGFQNKTVNRLLLQKRFRGAINEVFNNYYSVKLWNENLNFRINGKDLLPNGGIQNNTNYNVQLTTDSWGNYINTQGSNYSGLRGYDIVEDVLLANSTNYTGVVVGDKINTLQMEIKRGYKSSLDPVENGAVELLLFGEVLKVMVKDPKLGYQIIYS